jgi:anti-sigma B factor antagonist
MNLTSRRVGTAYLIDVAAPRIDASVAIKFKDQMRDISKDGPGRYILNLEQVEFIDSSGLGAVVGALKQMSPDQSLELASLHPTVSKVFELTRMNSVFMIHTDAQLALKHQAG